jgi:hypothetical protein
MNCRLCGTPLTQQNSCKAHILPASMLKEMAPAEYGSQILVVGMELPHPKNRPIGLYDSNILCRICDSSILGTYDKYAIRFVKEAILTAHPSGVGWSITGVDQTKLKLFILSYLWRSSITALEDFKGISLGSRHEENIRQMLINQNPGTTQDYTVNMARFEHEEKNFGGLLFPAKTRLDGVVAYEGYLPGMYKFWMKADSQPNSLLSNVSLGAEPEVFIHNKGPWRTSHEFQVMAMTVRGHK